MGECGQEALAYSGPVKPTSKTAAEMIGGMDPVMVAGDVAFASITDPQMLARLLPLARAIFREAEGISLILPLADHPDRANAAPMRQITLNVYSDLEGVGLTAAVATALAAEGIACNMVAAHHHDHVFVPSDRATEALTILLDLQKA
jgi:hypothetical protein